jgi:hypothetical protein
MVGPEFHRAIAIMSDQNGKLVAEQVILVDLVRVRTVFNPPLGR